MKSAVLRTRRRPEILCCPAIAFIILIIITSCQARLLPFMPLTLARAHSCLLKAFRTWRRQQASADRRENQLRSFLLSLSKYLSRVRQLQTCRSVGLFLDVKKKKKDRKEKRKQAPPYTIAVSVLHKRFSLKNNSVSCATTLTLANLIPNQPFEQSRFSSKFYDT